MTARLAVPFLKDTLGKTKQKKNTCSEYFHNATMSNNSLERCAGNRIPLKYICVAFSSLSQSASANAGNYVQIAHNISLLGFLVREMKK